MFLRPDLLSPGYSKLPAFPANNPAQLFQVGGAANWLGYIGSPRFANISLGAQVQQYISAEANALTLAIIAGTLDERDVPRLANFMLGIPPIAKSLEGATRYEAEVERKQREWMKKKGIK